jgi:hypothetical protein
MNIVGILDLDGFFVQKTFFCRELGIIACEDTYGTSFDFNTTLSYGKLNEKDKINTQFLQKHIHGLSLSDENGLDQDTKQRKCPGIQGRIHTKRITIETKHSFSQPRTFWMSQSRKHFPENGMVRKLWAA